MMDAGTKTANEPFAMLDLRAQCGARLAAGAALGTEALAAAVREVFRG